MPLLAAVVVLSLGVGIGVNLVVFSWLQAVVLQPLPGVGTHGRGVRRSASRDRNESGRLVARETRFARAGALGPEPHGIPHVPFNVGEASSNKRMYGLLVSENYFSALGLRPAAGRFFRPEAVRGPGRVTIVSHGLA